MPRNITALGGPGTPGQTFLALDLALTHAENSERRRGARPQAVLARNAPSGVTAVG